MIYDQNVQIQGQENYDQTGTKLVKKYYPRVNNEEVLDFVFEKDPNLYLRKNKILIKGFIEVDDSFVPDVGFVAKQFGQLSVDVDSHTVSKNKKS